MIPSNNDAIFDTLLFCLTDFKKMLDYNCGKKTTTLHIHAEGARLLRMNIHILSDVLRNFSPKVICPGSTDLDLEGVRYLPRNEEHWSPEYMYSVTPQELIGACYRSKKSSLNFLCSGSVDPLLLSERDWRAIILPESVDYREVFDTVQNTFKYYRKWEEQLNSAILSGSSLQEFLTIAAKVIETPLTIFSSASYYLCSAGDVSSSPLASLWGKLETFKFFPSDSMSTEEYQFLYSNLTVNRSPFSLWVSQRSSNNIDEWLPLTSSDGGLIGSIAAIGYSSISYGQQSLLCYIQNLFQRVYDRFSDADMLSVGLGCGMMDISGDVDFDLNTLPSLLPQYWTDGCEFHMFLVRSGQQQNSRTLLYNIVPQLRTCFQDAAFFTRNSELIVVTSGVITEKCGQHMQRILNSLRLFAVISDKFYKLASCVRAYSQCEMLFALASAPEHSLAWYTAEYQRCFAAAFGQKYSPVAFCNLALYEYILPRDRKRLEMLHSLQQYLMSGCNYSRAAETIGIHRNTIKRRLDRLSSILGMDLSALDEQEFTVLFISCTILEQLPDHFEYS